MIRPRPQLTVSLFAAMVLVAAATHADDSVEPESVLMTQHALTAEQAKTAQKAWAEHIGVDESLGRIVAKFSELSIENDMIVIFFSDNGGMAASE